MWIKTTILLLCGVLTIVVAIDEHRPKKMKDDGRGKRNLQYSISHHYNNNNNGGPFSYHQLERRISTGPQLPLFPITSPQYYPGPSSKYHKGSRPYNSYPLLPPYAVQMEPLVHYSQRDPLLDSNILSLNTDGPHHHQHHHQHQHHQVDDLLTDPTNNHLNDHIYGPPPYLPKQQHHQPTKIIEKPVFIKEPEPIIEIIIKESNVTLPPPPTPPPPPKKKEQVQVFYVKYKKNPNGYGKDSVIYDKPVPAISQPVHDDEETVPDYGPPQELVTSAPPPSTTLRTIIKPDSEIYHSPSGIKVTFGKEGFDYDKRSNKAEDLERVKVQFPQARQLSSFPTVPTPPNFQRRPVDFNNHRQPQPYTPFNHFSNFRQNQYQRPNPPQQQYSTLPRFAQLPQQQQRQPPPRPVPPQIPRQPVPYQPFENLRNPSPQQIQFRPQTHFPVSQQLPLNQAPNFNQFRPYQPQSSPTPPQPQPVQQNLNYHQQQQLPFRQSAQFNQQQFQQVPQQNEAQFNKPTTTQQLPFNQQQVQFNNNQNQQQNIVPPGGELIQSLPRFEQHISILESNNNQQQQQPQAQALQQNQARNHLTQEEYNNKIQQQFQQASALQESIRHNIQQPNQQYFNQQQQQQFYQTTAKPTTTTQRFSSTTATTTTTTTTTPIPSTTTKDPKLLNAQLPDEVPDDLRQQLLASGILNNADISILDYDKVGDIPLSALPPEQLSNFFSAGGAQQIASGSEPIPSYADKNGAILRNIDDSQTEETDQDDAASQIDEIRIKPENNVEMKVVHYNPETEQGQQIQQSYVRHDAKQLDPVDLNGEQYNRYLPLKVSGQQFPIPDVPELKGKKISSVVVLAPIINDFSSQTRQTRDAKPDELDLIKNGVLKELLKNPTAENYDKFLESENRTRSDQQSVILLVAGDPNDKEIYMFDVATKTVSRLDGELSNAFVEAAEANASQDADTDKLTSSSSNIVEARIPYPYDKIDKNIELESAASDIVETNIPIIDPIAAAAAAATTSDLDTEASQHLESFVDVSGMPIDDDLITAAATSEIRSIGSNSIQATGKTGF